MQSSLAVFLVVSLAFNPAIAQQKAGSPVVAGETVSPVVIAPRVPVPNTLLDGTAIKLWRACAVPGTHHAAPGTVIDAPGGTLRVACGDGQLELLTLQRPGGRRINAAAFLQGQPLPIGQSLAHS